MVPNIIIGNCQCVIVREWGGTQKTGETIKPFLICFTPVYGVEDAFNDAFQGSIHKNDSYTMLPTLKKMHGTAWKLIGDYVAEVAPAWDISIPKTAQGVACP